MQKESWVVSGPQVIEVESIRALRVQLVGGRVDVVAEDREDARLEVHDIVGRPLEVSIADGELKIGYAFTLGSWEGWLEKFKNFRDRDRADVHVAVPRRILAKVGTVSADGLVAGIDGQSSVGTVSGSLVVDSTTGRVTANTVSGEIVVHGHVGGLVLNGVSGDLAASGELDSVQANSVSGNVALDVTAGSTATSVTTVSGEATIRIPSGEGVSVRANAVSGRLVIDGEDYTGSTPGSRTVDLRRGEGGSTVTVNTVSGNITLLRGAGATAPSDAPSDAPADPPRDAVDDVPSDTPTAEAG
jgi:hypothetical protein